MRLLVRRASRELARYTPWCWFVRGSAPQSCTRLPSRTESTAVPQPVVEPTTKQMLAAWRLVTSFPTKETRSPFTVGLGRFPALRPSRSRLARTTSSAESVTQRRPSSLAREPGALDSVIGAPASPLVLIVRSSRKVPPARQPVSPAERLATRRAAVRKGCSAVPAAASSPVRDAYLVQTTATERGGARVWAETGCGGECFTSRTRSAEMLLRRRCERVCTSRRSVCPSDATRNRVLTTRQRRPTR